MTKKLILPDKEICDKYLVGMSSVELGKEYGCSYQTIINRLINNDIKIRSISEIRTKNYQIDLPIKEICDKYITGISPRKLAEEYNCCTNTIVKRLNDNNIKIRSNSEAQTDQYKVELPIETIIEKYINNITPEKLAREYKCSETAIRKRLNDNNIKIRSLSEVLENREIPQEERERKSAQPQKYCYLFNLTLKEAVRLYFNNNCFIDNEPEENGRNLSVHHVNYDKRCGCDATQFCIFVPVKAKWNTIFNGSKDKNKWYWYSFLMNKIFIEHPNYFTYHIPVWGMCELEYNYKYVFEKFRK
jgi:Mor family transcriptional regulator